MQIIQSKKHFKVSGSHTPHTIIIHHTAGGRIGSEDYLKLKGFGYHFMIDSFGAVYQYNDTSSIVSHAAGANRGFIGVSLICGGPLGAANTTQIEACKELCKTLKDNNDDLVHVSDHATIDVVVTGRKGKSDPQWPGEKVEQNVWAIKHKFIDEIAKYSNLEAIKTDGKCRI